MNSVTDKYLYEKREKMALNVCVTAVSTLNLTLKRTKCSKSYGDCVINYCPWGIGNYKIM